MWSIDWGDRWPREDAEISTALNFITGSIEYYYQRGIADEETQEKEQIVREIERDRKDDV